MLKFYITIPLFFISGFAQENSTAAQNEIITKLDLSNKGLVSLKDYDFSSYPSLEEVDLSNNNLMHIKENVFTKNEKLKKINLSGNKNLELPNFSTLLISNAEELDLSNCNITRLHKNIFDGLRYLKTIDVSNNPIKKKGFSVKSLYPIESLQKIILPNVTAHLLRELCKELSSLSVEVKIDDVAKSVDCKDYPATDTDPENGDEDDSVEIPPKTENLKPHLEPRNENATGTNSTNNTSVVGSIDLPIVIPENPEEPKINETGTNHTAVAGSIDIPLVVPNKPHLEPRSNETETSSSTNQTSVAASIDLSSKEANETSVIDKDVIKSNVSGTINNTDDAVKQVRSPIISVDKPVGENVNPDAEVKNGVPQEKLSEKMEEKDVKVGQVTETSNTGSTILIVLVIAVIVAGIAAFGYKFYKNRTQQASEPVERELKEIVATKPVGDDSIRDVTEQEPLMNNHVHKENGDPKSNQSQMLSNNFSTGPYQPTTTTFKPIDEDGK